MEPASSRQLKAHFVLNLRKPRDRAILKTMSDESDLPEIELDLEQMETPSPKRPAPKSSSTEMTDSRIILDWNVPHGQLAAKQRDGNATTKPAIRVSGKVQVTPKTRTNESPETGKFAPTFRALTFDGKMVDLVALRGKKVWLTFYRYSTCPLCNLHIAEVARRYPALRDAGVEVLAVFDSRVPDFYNPGKVENPPFSMISDSNGDLYRLYETRKSLFGVLRPSVLIRLIKAVFSGFPQGAVLGEFSQLPSSFLIDPNGMIREVRHGRTAVDFPPWSQLEAFSGARLASAKFGIVRN